MKVTLIKYITLLCVWNNMVWWMLMLQDCLGMMKQIYHWHEIWHGACHESESWWNLGIDFDKNIIWRNPPEAGQVASQSSCLAEGKLGRINGHHCWWSKVFMCFSIFLCYSSIDCLLSFVLVVRSLYCQPSLPPLDTEEVLIK